MNYLVVRVDNHQMVGLRLDSHGCRRTAVLRQSAVVLQQYHIYVKPIIIHQVMSTDENASKSLFAPYIKILEVCGAPTISIQVPTDYGLVN